MEIKTRRKMRVAGEVHQKHRAKRTRRLTSPLDTGRRSFRGLWAQQRLSDSPLACLEIWPTNSDVASHYGCASSALLAWDAS